MNISQNSIHKIKTFQLPPYNEIPDVGLYLKQVVKYINDTVGTTFGFTVTDTMLSNYVKMHIVPSPVKKQYYRDHIVQLLFISMAKSVLTLENIDNLMKRLHANYETKDAYFYFMHEFESTLRNVYGLEEISATPLSLTDDMVLLKNIIITMCYKFYLDDYFRNLSM